MILRDVEVGGVGGLDVRVGDGRITAIEPAGAGRGSPGTTEVLDGHGGALIPGLHDHHLHLLAMAARERSVACGPPAVTTHQELAATLRAAAITVEPGTWIRGVGFDDTITGSLDRAALDALVADHPVRVQHRGGHLWVVNRRGLEQLGLDPDGDGLLYDRDDLIRDRGSPATVAVDAVAVRRVSARLLAMGVTGITDATAANTRVTGDLFAQLIDAGAIHQQVLLLGDDDLAVPTHPRLRSGARKVILAEHDLPGLDDLAGTLRAAHDAERPVAVHAASRATLVLALAALETAGTHPGDRAEHASVAPPEIVAWMARLGIRVVTQHGFVAEHGDRYLAHVEADDQPWLYRGAGFLDAGVPLAGSTDAPFGSADPWTAMRAAVERRAASGESLGATEALTPEAALALFTGRAEDPGGPARRVEVGAPADLCLLSVPWAEARDHLDADLVAGTLVDGRLRHET